MHSLIITAHPSSQGFTHAIANTYREASEKKGYTTEILDLYKTELRLNFLHYEDKAELKNTSPVQQALQEKITAADELVFIFPIWWIGMPAILKNFFDVVFSSGFAYRYQKGKFFPQKLLQGKTAKVFCTCDARGIMYWLIGNPLRTVLKIGILGWCGVKTKKFIVFDRMRKRTPEELQKMLQKVQKIA